METKNTPFPIFLSLKEAASAIGISYDVFRKWCQRKNGPPLYKFSRTRIKIRKDELFDWIETKKRNVYAQPVHSSPRQPGGVDAHVQDKGNGARSVG